MSEEAASAIARVPAGAWAVGVSGGADSVALLHLLRHRDDLSLHVVHLDHETRGGESAADAQFVVDLAERWNLPVTVAFRSEIEATFPALERNTSARYRAARLALFERVIRQHDLAGVILAHHADDQAETVLQRLIRGSGPAGLVGMAQRSIVRSVLILRPLLRVSGGALRDLLRKSEIAWREDSSNATSVQQRSRVRQALAEHPELSRALIKLADACAAMTAAIRARTPRLGESFDVAQLCDLPGPVAREAARAWLQERAEAGVEITTAATQRLVEMATDAASPARQDYPGGVQVRRRGGIIMAMGRSSPADARSPSTG